MQQTVSWELLSLISKLPRLDPLGFGMSHGGERGGVGSTHFSADTTKLCYSLMFVSGMIQKLQLWGAVWLGSDSLKTGVVRFAVGREPPAVLQKHGEAALAVA